MQWQQIHHVAIIVSDYRKAKEFYVEKLGFPILPGKLPPGPGTGSWTCGWDAVELEIFAEPDPPRRPTRPEACGLRHLAFRVADPDAAVADLAKRGIRCEPCAPTSSPAGG